MARFVGWRYAAFIGGLVGAVAITMYPIAIYPMMHIDEYSRLKVNLDYLNLRMFVL